MTSSSATIYSGALGAKTSIYIGSQTPIEDWGSPALANSCPLVATCPAGENPALKWCYCSTYGKSRSAVPDLKAAPKSDVIMSGILGGKHCVLRTKLYGLMQNLRKSSAPKTDCLPNMMTLLPSHHTEDCTSHIYKKVPWCYFQHPKKCFGSSPPTQ